MDTHKIEEIWEEQKSKIENKNEGDYALERRMILDDGKPSPIYVATRYRDRQKGFTISISSKVSKKTIPDEGQHFSIESEIQSDGSRRYWWGLKNNDYHDQFLTMGKRVSENSAKGKNDEDSLEIFLKEITHWISFLKDYERFPSRPYIIGLFGELSFMKNIIDTTGNYEDVINAWKNGNPTKDFYFSDSVFEIKASTSNPMTAVNIGSWNQLDETSVNNNLILSTVTLNESDPKGFYIYELVEKLTEMFKENADHLSKIFYEKLSNENYFMSNNQMYKKKSSKFSVHNIKYFQIRDNFPRITPPDIENLDRPGIESITYKVDYSHLLEFEIDFNDIQALSST